MFANCKLQIAALCLVAAACGGKHGDEQSDAGTSVYNLTLAGAPSILVHPSDKRVLQVVLSQDQVGPVANAKVHFEFQDGDPAGAALDGADVTTDNNGIATVHFTAGRVTDRNLVPKVVVTAPSFDASPVAFSFSVVPIRRLLQIVSSPVTHVDQTGQNATTSVGISTSSALRVRELDADTGNAIAGDTLAFTKPAGAKATFSGSTGNSATAQTGAGGDAQVYLLSSTTAEGPFLVSAASAAGGGTTVYFSVTVTASASSCASSQNCDPGQICVNGHCQAGGGGQGCDNNSDNPCPFGWFCVDGICQQPAASCTSDTNCVNGQCCDTSNGTCKDMCPVCQTGYHCVAGASCGTGTCQPDAATIPDVTGVWMTEHSYDIRQALPTVMQDIGEAFRLLDQALHGKLTIPGVPSWLNDLVNQLLSKLLQQYLPQWAQLVIEIGDDIFTVLSDLRSEGSMRLVQGVDLAHVKGTEVWTSLVFYWLPLCGNNIGGDPTVPPPCARIDLFTTDSDNPGEVGQCKGQSLPSITVQVAPFTANVSGTQAPFQLNVDQRQVKVKMGKVVLVLVDYMIYYATGGEYHCIDEATDCANNNPCLIPCDQIGQDVSDWTGGLIDPGIVAGVCEQAVTVAGQAVSTALANAWSPTAEVLDFNGFSAISGTADATLCDTGQNCAGLLGNDNYDVDLHKTPATRNGSWTGAFFLGTIKNMPGAWEGKRPE